MKKLLLFIALIQLSVITFAQDSPTAGALYKFKSPMKMAKCDENGDATADLTLYPIAVNWQFTIQKIVAKGIVISFANWSAPDTPQTSKERSQATLNSRYAGAPDAPIYFLLSVSELNAYTTRLQHGGTVSLVTGLSFIKFRPGSGTPISKDGKDYYKNTDISNDFTFSVLGSLKLSPAGSNSDFFALFGFNFSSIKVTPATTQGFLTSETNVGSVAPTIGIQYQIDRVQFGLLSGVDILTGDVNRHFVYRGRPWVAIGIGFSILKGYGTSTSSNSNP